MRRYSSSRLRTSRAVRSGIPVTADNSPAVRQGICDRASSVVSELIEAFMVGPLHAAVRTPGRLLHQTAGS